MMERTGAFLLAGQDEISDLHKRTYDFLKRGGRHILFRDYEFERQVELPGVHLQVQIRSVTELRGPMVFIAARSGDFTRLISIKDGRKKFSLVADTTLDDIVASEDMSDQERKMFDERSNFRPASEDDVAMFKNIILLLGGDKDV